MSITACLLLYSVAVLVSAPRILHFLTRDGHAPRSGVVVWLVAIGTVLLTWMIVAVMLVLDLVAHWRRGGSFVASCIELLCDYAAGDAGLVPQVLLLTGSAAVIGAVAAVGFRVMRVIRGLRARTHGHAQAVRLVGRPTGDRDVYVVDAVERTAYCVAGKPPAIVVTSAALAALDERSLRAILAHERAHLDGNHIRIVAALRGLARVFPYLPLMRRGATEVSRLLEMCADDAAVRRHGSGALLSGLMTLAAGAPAAALGAGDVAVLTRAQRLAVPATQPVRLRAQAALTSICTVLAVGPIGTLALAATGVWICGG